MFTKLLTFSALLVSCNSSPINGTVSEQNVVKREANAGDLFPDWVPFKNKHGEELGEFIQVERKNKVKKRLAPPVNFILKAVADEGDDYYDKGAGESDSDDNYENKDWSDVNRPDTKENVDDKSLSVNHTDISDIDGVVDIIIKKPDPIIAVLESANKRTEELKKERAKLLSGEELEPEQDTSKDSQPDEPAPNKDKSSEKSEEEGGEEDKGEEKEENKEEEKKEEKSKLSSAEVKENEARKAKILGAVDELKHRHAEEQRQINLSDRLSERYRDQESYEETEPRSQRRSGKKKRIPTTTPDYDEYEDENRSLNNKYKFNVLKSAASTESDESDEHLRPTTSLPKQSSKHVPGKLSVFRNPSVYELNDGETTTRSANSLRGSQRFSSKYTTTPASTEDDRISFLEAKKVHTPIPKKRKNRRKKTKTTTPSELDSSVAETVTDNYKQTTGFDSTATGNTVSVETTGTDVTGPTADAAATNTDAITDAVPASSDHKKEEHGDYDVKKGGGREHHSEHSEEHEEHGKKAYEGHHEDSKTAKGHHDKENHLGKYDDHGGVDKHHSEETGHYGDHHHEEHGKKHAKYEESGKHSKGHSTKGSHDIHKKEEYEKNVEFFEEEGDSGEEEKHGGYNHEKEHAEGGHFKHGKLKADHEHHDKGESGHFAKGGHGSSHKGHKQAHGHDSHGKHGQKHFHKGGREGGKKWVYHHGTPAKTANLVVIDRRGDQYYHGPHYYG